MGINLSITCRKVGCTFESSIVSNGAGGFFSGGSGMVEGLYCPSCRHRGLCSMDIDDEPVFKCYSCAEKWESVSCPACGAPISAAHTSGFGFFT